MNLAAWLLEAGVDDDTVLAWRGGQATYAELRASVRRVAACVRQFAQRDGDAIIPLVGGNSIEWVASYLGVLYAGAVPALVPPTTLVNLRAVFGEVDARLALVDPGLAGGLTGLATTILPFDEATTNAITDDAPVAKPRAEMSALLYTSGSTGRPKGVMLSASNLVANAEAILAACPLDRADRAFQTLPFFYCYGLSVLHTHLRAGASLYLSRAELPEAIVDDLVESDATGMPSIPSLFQTLATRSTLADRPPRRLRYVMVSGGRMADAALERLARALPGTTVHVRYGVTELTAAASFLPPEHRLAKVGSIGRGLAGGELSVERGSDEVGELVVRGAHVAMGYFRDDVLTRERFRDGAFHTGDLARIDADGFIYLVGRRAEFVKTIGHRVSPAEVEEVLALAPGVLEAGVCGVPHPVRGEALVAAVVLAPGAASTPATLLRHCASQLPAFKVPTKVVILDALPRTPNQKLDRARLGALLSGG
ncbi:MAG TPA: class I adenylate-forming enzyme family protein [Kofleriaceae bacterium]